MIARFLVRSVGVGALGFALFTAPSFAQPKEPTPAMVTLARQIIEAKGGLNMFDAVVVGVIEHHKNLLVQVNPNASKDLEDVSVKLRAEVGPAKTTEIQTEIARGFAAQFTEQELKDVLAFYRTPLGKKLIDAEPKGLDEASKRVEEWAQKFADEVTSRLRADMKKRGHNLL